MAGLGPRREWCPLIHVLQTRPTAADADADADGATYAIRPKSECDIEHTFLNVHNIEHILQSALRTGHPHRTARIPLPTVVPTFIGAPTRFPSHRTRLRFRRRRLAAHLRFRTWLIVRAPITPGTRQQAHCVSGYQRTPLHACCNSACVGAVTS
jgi:hypothetical protein